MTLLVIDPYLVYAHWEVGPDTETSQATLRVYDATNETANHFDMAVSLPDRHAYIDVWTPERSCYAELGLLDSDGVFTMLARSNPVRTPRAWPAADPEQAPVEDVQIEPYDAPAAADPAAEPKTEVVAPTKPAAQPDSTAMTDVISERLESENPRGFQDSARAQTEPPAPQHVPEYQPVSESVSEPGPVPEIRPIPEPPHTPEIVDAARILRTRLEAIYAAIPWRPRARPISESSAPDNPSVPATRRILPYNLTSLAEARFSPGASSKTSEPPA